MKLYTEEQVKKAMLEYISSINLTRVQVINTITTYIDGYLVWHIFELNR